MPNDVAPADKKALLESALNSPSKQRRDVARVRASLVHLARGNVEKVQEWLDQVAEGIKVDVPVVGDDGLPTGETLSRWLNEPDPARALDLFFKMLKFSVPELRAVAVDLNVREDQPARKMSLAELEALLREESEDVIDGEVLSEGE